MTGTYDLRTPCCQAYPQQIEKTYLAQRAAAFTDTPDGPEPVDWYAYQVVDEERWDARWECSDCCEPVTLRECNRVPTKGVA